MKRLFIVVFLLANYAFGQNDLSMQAHVRTATWLANEYANQRSIPSIGPFAPLPIKHSLFKRIFDLNGKPIYWTSVIALGFAHAFDYRTTETALQSGAGTEGNPFLRRIVQDRKNFAWFKLGAGAIPVGGELWHMRKHPEYRPIYTIANFGMAGVFGAIAWHNHQISVEAQK